MYPLIRLSTVCSIFHFIGNPTKCAMNRTKPRLKKNRRLSGKIGNACQKIPQKWYYFPVFLTYSILTQFSI